MHVHISKNSDSKIVTRVVSCLATLLWLSGCGSKTPTDPDQLPPFIDWLTPQPSVDSVFVFATDTTTIEFAAGDDGGVVSLVQVFMDNALVASLSTAPFRTVLDIQSIPNNRSQRVWAIAHDPTGKQSATPDTLRFVRSPLPDTAAWTLLAPARLPWPRFGHTLTADPVNQRALLFGGIDPIGSGNLNDLWAFDFTTNSWDSLSIANDSVAPEPRSTHAAALVGDRLLIFGGQGDSLSLLQDSHLLLFASNMWITTTPPFLPSEPVANLRAVSWGGNAYAYGGNKDNLIARDYLWTYSGTSGQWSFTPGQLMGPGTRMLAALAVSSEAGILFLYGGIQSPLNNTPSDTSNYRYYIQNQSWIKRQPPPGPPPVAEGCAVYDSLNNRIVMWGGRDNTGARRTEVWEFSMGSSVWREVPVSSGPPGGRVGHQVVMDQAGKRVILFGGEVGGFASNETWELAW